MGNPLSYNGLRRDGPRTEVAFCVNQKAFRATLRSVGIFTEQ